VLGPTLLRTGGLNVSSPPEIVAYVWLFLTLKDLVTFGCTSRANHHLVHGALWNMVYHLIAPFIPKRGVDHFLCTLQLECAVISCLMALFPLMFCNFSRTNNNEPKRGKEGSGVLRYLLDVEGYEERKIQERSLREKYDAWWGIRQVKLVEQDGLHVDIVTSVSSSAITHILFPFHARL
jgi:hypothetical protein